MQYYIAVVCKGDDEGFGMYFPEVPGCFSAADTFDDLIINASEALGLHLEGEDYPKVILLHKILDNPDVKKDLDEGAFLLSIPVTLPRNK